MIYLSGCLPIKETIQKRLLLHNVGLMLTPNSQRSVPSDVWQYAADNGCFANNWEESKWLRWLETINPNKALFASVPDVVGDYVSTLLLWEIHADRVKRMGFKIAFVLQDGIQFKDIPIESADAFFIGGSTAWKLSESTKKLVTQIKEYDKWVHMGRVNSYRRLQIARDMGCDSTDGTYTAFAPDMNSIKLINMLDKLNRQPALQV